MSRKLLLWTALLVAAAFVPAPAAGAGIPIQPGDMIVIDGSGLCTLNFVFRGTDTLEGKVYIGTAAHCIAGNRNAKIDHYNGNFAGQGMGGYFLASRTATSFATVAWLGDYGDSVNGGPSLDNGLPGAQLDFALLEVKPAFLDRVSPAVRGHPDTPVGFTVHTETAQRDLLWHSGHGVAYSDVRHLRENHPGILYSDNARTYVELGTSLPGDSGGPIIHEKTGKAFGIVSGSEAGFAVPPYRDLGPTVEGVLAELASFGVTVELATV